ncbi:TRAP transporter substrate-binding protein DctP [Afifella sp. IM 167]|uniref:TRAP transporter substrate-binding protein n=1 Tax=Afifella sp. IM 167 TaxID=2033586 RepID=UPI001CC93212|nr:TRAP transporter substrate-binding protein DctP [Afifella sp. IM 167]MBZ8134651.1 C4-dicarboxylate ABC transporter substrate-binding protein [Afifella sp. IM 167]
MKRISSRLLLSLAILGSTATAGSAETLVVSNGLSPAHYISKSGFEPWMACVQERAGDSIDFNYMPGGQIASVKNSIDSLESGLAQVAYIAPSNEASKLPLSAITVLPGLGDSATSLLQTFRKVFDGDGPVAKEVASNHFIPLVIVALPPYQVMTVGEPIDTLEKFAGHKIRTAGGAMTFTVETLGAAPVEMPAGDLYVAMQRGTVDSTIFALASGKSYSIQELVKSVSRNASFGSGGGFIGISQETWDGLSEENRTIFRDCGHKAEADLAAKLDRENGELADEFAGLGIDVFEYSDEELKAIDAKLQEVNADYIDRLEKRGLPGKEAYDSFVAAAGK